LDPVQGSLPQGSTTFPVVEMVCICAQKRENVRDVVSCGSGPTVGGAAGSGAAGRPVLGDHLGDHCRGGSDRSPHGRSHRGGRGQLL
jgi:hypothetical protein